jgi:hypothetical protein
MGTPFFSIVATQLSRLGVGGASQMTYSFSPAAILRWRFVG